MQIPSDPISAAIWGINLALAALSVNDRYEKLRNDFAAVAESEGRDINETEQTILDAMLEQSKKARDGK